MVSTDRDRVLVEATFLREWATDLLVRVRSVSLRALVDSAVVDLDELPRLFDAPERQMAALISPRAKLARAAAILARDGPESLVLPDELPPLVG